MQKKENSKYDINKKFLNEVLNSKLCPNNFEKIYKEFEIYQKMALETLWEFHDICEKNNILYEVACGSLLGLIRDGGQLPWDYDIDVFVPIEMKDDLIKALDKELSKKYYYNYLNNNKNCQHMLMRLAPVGYRTEALHLDVFFLMGSPDDEKNRIELQKRIRKICFIRHFKYVDIKYEGYKNFKKKLKILIRKLQYLFVPMNALMNKYYCLCKKYPALHSKYNIIADINAMVATFESKNLWDTFLTKDNFGHELRIPKNYDAVLKARYGNYKKVPDISERINDVLESHKKLIRSKIEDNEKSSK